MTFEQFLEARNIDQQTLTKELAAALVAQWEAEFPPMDTQKCAPSILLIPDGIEERWSRAVRCEVAL